MTLQANRRRVLKGAIVAAGVVSGSAGAHAAPAPLLPLPKHDGPIPVAFLMDDRATMIDFAGPWEAFQDAAVANVPGFELYTVAPTRASIRSSGGMEIVPKYALVDAPQPKVVVIPAQAGGRQNTPTAAAKVGWLRHVHDKADIVMSVCTGAFLLARTGLLDGLSATTHHDFYDQFASTYPKVRLVRGRRFVDNGKFVTAGGLTSGVDGALHVIARYYGIDAARVSAEYMEHHGTGWLSGEQGG
jgi:transcriptional regulator GlxA family with amidase domain